LVDIVDVKINRYLIWDGSGVGDGDEGRLPEEERISLRLQVSSIGLINIH